LKMGVGAADALAAEYPADEYAGYGRRRRSDRSLAYFHPEDTDKAVAIEKRLLSVKPDDLDTLARIGDIYADRGRMNEAAPYWTRMAEVHPGEADGYLQSATVFWDYFDFASASAQMRKARERLAEPALFGYQAGAIEESQNNLPSAIQEYVASSLGDKPSEESRDRLLELARRPEWRAAVETETAGLLKQTAPTSAAIELRIGVLDAQQRTEDRLRELKLAVAQTESFDVLDALTAAARTHALPKVEQLALSRQIALTIRSGALPGVALSAGGSAAAAQSGGGSDGSGRDSIASTRRFSAWCARPWTMTGHTSASRRR
jgi:tetratricopeptide (TPR) repeat protein